MILSVGNQSGAVKRRLVDMGLTPGTTVKVTKVAPLGDPLEVSLRGYELSLRKDDAAQIRIGAPRRPAAREDGARRTDPERACKQLQDHVHELEQHGRPYDHSAHDSRPMRIALAGNPNCGKTTLFNALTGSNQYVGNWPGVTVEKKEGTARLGDRELTVVDLPGIYSLSPYSMEEIVARDFIICEGPDAILNIVDATNLERNLYLTVQLLELERPLVLALNFMDEVEARGTPSMWSASPGSWASPWSPSPPRLARDWTSCSRRPTGRCTWAVPLSPDDLYDSFTHDIHHRMGELLHDYAYSAHLPAHWAAIKLLEGDKLVEEALHLPRAVQEELRSIIAEYEASSDLGDRETLIADSRYQYIERVVEASVVKGARCRRTHPQRADRPGGHRQVHRPPPVPVRHAGHVHHHLRSLRLLAAKRRQRPDRPVFRLAGRDPGRRGRLPGAHQPGVRRHHRRGGRRALLSAPDRPAVLLSLLSGGLGLYVPGRLHHGPAAAPLRTKREGLYPHAHGLWLLRPRHHGGPHHGKREGPADDHSPGPLHVLLGQASRLWHDLALSSAPGLNLVVFGLYVLGMLAGILSGLLFKRTLFAGDPAPFVLELPPTACHPLKTSPPMCGRR